MLQQGRLTKSHLVTLDVSPPCDGDRLVAAPHRLVDQVQRACVIGIDGQRALTAKPSLQHLPRFQMPMAGFALGGGRNCTGTCLRFPGAALSAVHRLLFRK